MRDWTFANTFRHDGIASAYDAAKRLAKKPRRFLTLLGSFGVGKTRLLACMVNEARAAGLPAVYTTTADLLDRLRTAYAPDAKVGYDQRLELLTTARVPRLDEFDRFHSTDWAEEKLFQLIEARYQRGQDELTCFATNKTPEELPPYLLSRLRDTQCCLFELTGQDVRERKRWSPHPVLHFYSVLDPDRYGGRVRVDRHGQPVIDYHLHPYDAQRLMDGLVASLRLHLAASAEEVSTLHARPVGYRRSGGGDFEAFLRNVRAAGLPANRVTLLSAHQLSSCRIGGDARLGALDPTGQSYEVRRLYVADGSVLPTQAG